MNVLIVDDQPEVVESMVTGVNWKKIPVEQVFTAYSVKEAQSVFERERIDVLLCDIEMPPTNGFALLRWAQERFSGLVCIFLSAHAEFEYAQEAVKLGSFDYILQPAPYAEIEAAVERAAGKVRSAKPNKWLRFYRCIPLYLMFLPGALYLLMDKYIPMSGLIIAFKKVNWRKGILASDWVGFSNFTYLFKTKDAFNITRNTLLYNLCFIVLGTVIAITIAILLNEITSKLFKQVYQTIILMPYLISIVVVSYLVFAMLSSESGFINNTIFKALGINPISWYTEPKYWPFILVIVHIWKVFGYDCILYYATLVGIDHGYYAIKTAHVTLPSLLPTIITLTLMSIGKIFYSDFGLFYQVPMDSGPLLDITSTIDTYVYRALITLNDYGRSSAAGVYQSVVGFILVLCANLAVKKIGGEENALF